jgi:anti-sigma B factor antagonist
MEYSVLEKKDCIVVALKGQIMGGPAAKEFRSKISSLIEEGKTNIIGDLSEVSFMNSSGLGILISTLTSLRKEGGDFKLCSPTDRIRSLLKISKLFTVFDLYETLDEAIASYQK